MPLENGKWRVVKGDCLWNIAKSVYGNGSRWTEIANANGVNTKTALIYPGQIFTLPGITPGSGSANPPTPAPPPPAISKVRIDWFKLTAGSQKEMECLWSWGGSPQRFWIKWEEYDSNGNKWVIAENTNYATTTGETPQYRQAATDRGKRIRVSIRPVKEDGSYQDYTDWAVEEYDFANNPPDLPPDPTFEIDSFNKMTVRMDNIDEDINADSIEIAIYQDDTIKYKTVKVPINKETRFISYVETVDAGHVYKIRCRAVRGSIEGGWTNFTGNDSSTPIAPSEITTLRTQVISEQMAKQYGVFVEWNEVQTAKQYIVQWTTNLEYFDIPGGEISSITTKEGEGPRTLITEIKTGHEYFFRVGSLNDKGQSLNWSAIRSIKLGSKPSPPTTWSNVSSAVIGEDLNLYWTHNATDGSIETYARLYMSIIDSAHPELEPMEVIKVIPNERPEEEKDSNGVYTINTNDPEWSVLLSEGCIIKWNVQTAGVVGDYSDPSVEREVNIYAKPELSLDITNKDGGSISTIVSFPFHISVLARPATQKPISYYIEVVSNGAYDTVDQVGNVKSINPGDKVYQKYYDPDRNAWRFLVEMTPGNIDLQSGINYTVNVTVSMDSGLTAEASQNFDVSFAEQSYLVYGDVLINKENLTASIKPYCKEYYQDGSELKTKLSEDCSLAVYRREYDGTFTEIAINLNNDNITYVMDPHPSLDYARYRIVAKSNITGTISYKDLDGVYVGEPGIIIQWSEKWTNFDIDPNLEDNYIEVPWAGSMLKLPYNVDTNENKNPDIALVEYAGRQHPVSYYGTQLGETASWNTEIPADDKETIYALRRLSKFMGDVYVRESSGVGYWAQIGVSMNIKHLSPTIPVSLDVKRVEGGM